MYTRGESQCVGNRGEQDQAYPKVSHLNGCLSVDDRNVNNLMRNP